VLACAKHFAGDGATTGGVDQGNAELDEATFRRLGVEVYQPLINAGVGNIMVSYSSYNGAKMTGSRQWLMDVLKGEMGFSGFLGSDWAATGQLSGAMDAQVAAAVNAGLDMLMEPYLWSEAVDMIERGPSASGSGNIPETRIDDAVMRILSVKCELGMLEPGYDPSGDAGLLSEVGSEAHRDVARQAVRESAVLLENNAALPIPETAVVHVAGSGADSLVRQCGGWTVDWQGLGITSANRTPGVTSGTTILTGIQTIAGQGNVTFSEDGSGVPAGVTHIIVVLSEAPYAEGQGDSTDLDLGARTPDVPVLQAVSSAGVPVIAVLLSGRPLIIEPYLELADAWVAAWLPGSEANALADVLFGRHPPGGKLGHSWPRSMAQIPINLGDADYESDPPLYPFGHGLGY
jgi:beta-glucosidase